MAFAWTSFACYFLASVLFCIGGTVGRDSPRSSGSSFKRKRSTRSTRSRGSFLDSESQRRVKDNYS